MSGDEVTFGQFRLDLRRRVLLCGGEPVRLGGRALEILCALASAGGHVVGKDELMARVWAGRAVEEGNVHVHISTLRKALDDHAEGHGYIVTIPGRGYRFAPAGTRSDQAAPAAPALVLLDKPSIAVLPFANLSGDPDQQFFVDGVAEEIITALGRIRWLWVIARNASFRFNGRTDPTEVGRELGVRYLLEGSFRKAGERIRITARLIDASSGAQLWADRFDSSLQDIFDLQDRVAARVAGIIEPTLQLAEVARSAGRRTGDHTAYELYLRADRMVNLASALLPEALQLLQQATGRDPGYGPALALAAVCCSRLVQNGQSEDPERHDRIGAEYARRALQVARDDAGTLINAALALTYAGEDIGTMMELADRALALNPSFARGWYVSAMIRGWAGLHEQLIEHTDMALRLTPGVRLGLATRNLYGSAYLFTHRFEHAVRELQFAVHEDPSYPTSYRFLAAAYAHLGRIDEARDIVSRLRAITPALFPPKRMFRNPADHALLISGLKIAAGKTG
jgi:adenylate cyclase